MASEFTKRIYEVVRQIPRGCVASYGQVAFLAGNPRGACGGLAFGGEGVQRALLEEEGVVFLPDGRVDMARCGWLK